MSQAKQESVVLCTRWAGFQGGAEQHVHDLAQGFRQKGVMCKLVYLEVGHQGERFLDAFATSEQVELDTFSNWLIEHAPARVYFHQWPLSHVGPEHLPHTRRWFMVHDSSLFCPRQHMYTPLDGKTCEKPLTWRCQAKCQLLSNPKRWNAPGLLRKNLLLLRRMEGVVCASAYLVDTLKKLGVPSKKLSCIPLARRWESPLESAPPTRTQTPELLFVGSLFKSKGLDLLLAALAELEDGFVCRIVGRGKGLRRLQLLSLRKGFGYGKRSHQKIVFEGWKSQADLSPLYQGADVLVLPSRSPETFGLVGLEAMKHGLPVVAFDAGGVSQWLHHEQNGLLIPLGDVSAMSKAISRFIRNQDEAQRMGQMGRETLEQEFHFDLLLQRVQDLFSLAV